MDSDVGTRIRQELKKRDWPQYVLAKVMDRPVAAINALISGRIQLTTETAFQLSAALGGTPEEWLALEARFRVRLGSNFDGSEIESRSKLFSSAPIQAIENRGWIPKSKNADELKQLLSDFLNPDLSIFTKRTYYDQLNGSQKAWCARAAHVSKDIVVPKFNQQAFEDGVQELRTLTKWPEEARKVPGVLSSMGIKFVVVEPLPRTRIDGATFWHNGSPVVCLSIRFDRVDSFWHTLGHELSHVRHQDSISVDTNIFGEDKISLEHEIELRADKEGAEMWIDGKIMNEFVVRHSPFYDQATINRFASKIKVHPGIIVGQLQHRGEITYATYRQALKPIRNIVLSTAIVDGWGHTISV